MTTAVTVDAADYIGVPPDAFLVQPSFDVENIGAELDEDAWRRAGWDCRELGGPPQVICSDDADYERADYRILDHRICLTRAIVECL